MPLPYTKYGYTWPPRPETAVPPSLLSSYQEKGWVGQIKKNGTCTVIFAGNDQAIFKNRHNEDHKAWKPLNEHITFFKELSKNGWCVFEAELLHSKGNSVKNTLYIFDILVWEGTYLIGSTFAERQVLLQKIFKDRLTPGNFDHDIIAPKIWLAKLLEGNFNQIWSGLTHSEDEGIVLKNPTATLKLCNKPNSNVGWQLKCRRVHKNYGF